MSYKTALRKLTKELMIRGALRKLTKELMIRGDEHDYDVMFTLTQISSYRRDGTIVAEVWQRDCDGVEGTSLCTIPATLEALQELREDVYWNAEGPCSVRILSPEQADKWEPYFRDRFAEMMNY